MSSVCHTDAFANDNDVGELGDDDGEAEEVPEEVGPVDGGEAVPDGVAGSGALLGPDCRGGSRVDPAFPAAPEGQVHGVTAGALLAPSAKGCVPVAATVDGVPLVADTVFGSEPDADTTATPPAHTTPAVISTMAAAAELTVRDTTGTSGDARAGSIRREPRRAAAIEVVLGQGEKWPGTGGPRLRNAVLR